VVKPLRSRVLKPDPAPSEANNKTSYAPRYTRMSLSTVPSPLPAFPAMGGRPVPADELLARAEANGRKRDEHEEKDKVRNPDKYVPKTKKDQDTALDFYQL
jgi:hypothetical protein